MFSYEFVISTLTFTIVMILFNIVKDYLIIPQYRPNKATLDRINKRWYISFIIGVIILYAVYGRGSP